ncbi:MAG TPA: hypothetical protein VFA45_24150 [Actinomycetes bacterium]|jgi:hypothetical protein|nr:hypothetical protein [Actinomycetes bacterium]
MHEQLRELSGLLRIGRRLDELHSGAVALLREIAVSRASFAAVRHPLGFIYATLLREGPTALRLHIWLAGLARPRLTTSPIHDHTWQLMSYVICGELENHIVEINDSAEPTHRVFEIKGAGGADRLRPTDRLVRFRVASVQRVQARERYTIEAGRFHFTEVSSDRTVATLVLAERKAPVPERSLGPRHLSEHQTTREACPPGELRSAAARVLDTLVNQSVAK